jgi:hypothetical protein
VFLISKRIAFSDRSKSEQEILEDEKEQNPTITPHTLHARTSNLHPN